jgi:hypothetical protein
MKRHAFPILIILLHFNLPSFARIGETPQECIARYGKPINVLRHEKSMQFKKAGFLVLIQFKNNIAEGIVYQREGRQVEDTGVYAIGSISEFELMKFLKANGGDREWKEVGADYKWTAWRTSDDQLFARYETENMTLCINKLDQAKESKIDDKNEPDF